MRSGRAGGGGWGPEVRSHRSEVRFDAATRVVRGYAAVFGAASCPLRDEDGHAFVETIRPGAFARGLAESDVRALYNHDEAYVLGRQRAGTLRLWEDSTGLGYEVSLGDRSYDRDLAESLARGDVFGSSFSFACYDEEWGETEDGTPLRTLRGVHLFDVGPVAFPAYRAATATLVAARSAAEARSARLAAAAATPPTPAPAARVPGIADLAPFLFHGPR